LEEAAGRLAAGLQNRRGEVPESSLVGRAAAGSGWDSEELMSACMDKVDIMASLLACSPEGAAALLIDSPEALAIPEAHIARCLMTLRDLLPNTDVSDLVRRRPELLLEEDAMDRAREAVCIMAAKGLDPCQLAARRPLVLLRHGVWFSQGADECKWDDTGAMEHDAP